MKKGLLVTTMVAASALLLASCAKSISYEEAKKHCDDNFTSTEIKTFNVHSKMDVKKAEGVFAKLYEVGVKEEDDESKAGVLTSAALAVYGESFSYKADGTKLIIEGEYSLKDILKEYGVTLPDGAEASGSAYAKAETDGEGFPALGYSKSNFSFSYSAGGITVEGALEMEETITYSVK